MAFLCAFAAVSASGPTSRLSAQSLTLMDAADAALESHPSLSAAAARVSASREAGDAARAARLPGAALSATLTRFQEPMVVAPLHSLNLTSPPRFDRTLVQGQLAAQYTLFDGARSPRIRGADVALEASELTLEDTRMSVLEETAAAYLEVLAARAVLAAGFVEVALVVEPGEAVGDRQALERRFHFLALGEVVEEADAADALIVVEKLRCRQANVDAAAVAATQHRLEAFDLPGLSVFVAVHQPPDFAREFGRVVERADVQPPDDFFAGVAEQPFGGGIEQIDHTAPVDADDRVGADRDQIVQ
jgi:hypothetical protein